MFRLNSKYRKEHTILKKYGFILEPTKDGYSYKTDNIEVYIPIRSYDVFREFYVYIIPECSTIISNELDFLIAMFEIGILENYLT